MTRGTCHQGEGARQFFCLIVLLIMCCTWCWTSKVNAQWEKNLDKNKHEEEEKSHVYVCLYMSVQLWVYITANRCWKTHYSRLKLASPSDTINNSFCFQELDTHTWLPPFRLETSKCGRSDTHNKSVRTCYASRAVAPVPTKKYKERSGMLQLNRLVLLQIANSSCRTWYRIQVDISNVAIASSWVECNCS